MENKSNKDLLDRILSRENMKSALKRVRRNHGKPGIDGMTVDELPAHLVNAWPFIRQELVDGTYVPKAVRRVEIPKSDGGTRLLGIPTVVDRLIQQAITQVLTPVFEEEFSEHSYGFRPGRSQKDAIEAARKHIDEGYDWVVDIDLEKFFDRVNHDKLMARIARKVSDKRVLKLIRKYLESGVMINGVKVSTEEGTPQGGNLSPLLANIILTDLDRELESRGHRFCRYADDCNIYVRSERAGSRIMESIGRYIEKHLKLKVNKDKSAVDRPWKRKFLGFSFYRHKEGIRVRIHPKSVKKFKARVREITNRNKSMNFDERLKQLGSFTVGWLIYFGYADAKKTLQGLDEWIRRRLRACLWKQWKKVRTKYHNLKRLGVDEEKAWEWVNTRKSYWRIAKSFILSTTVSNLYLEERGYKSLVQYYLVVH